MHFKDWLKEWEGNSFPGDDSQYYNTPDYPESRYKGPGMKVKGNLDKINKEFGFKMVKKMKKNSSPN